MTNKEQLSMPRCDIEKLKDELREVLKVLLRESPKHEAWVMKNWGHLLKGKKDA